MKVHATRRPAVRGVSGPGTSSRELTSLKWRTQNDRSLPEDDCGKGKVMPKAKCKEASWPSPPTSSNGADTASSPVMPVAPASGTPPSPPTTSNGADTASSPGTPPSPAPVTAGSTSSSDATAQVDTCPNAPAGSTRTLEYTYSMVTTQGITDDRVDEILAKIEEGTHTGLVNNLLLPCNFRMRRELSTFDYISITSDPEDSRLGACDEGPSDKDCYVLNGGIGVTYLPGGTPEEFEYEIATSLTEIMDGGTLNDLDPDLEQVNFISFTQDTVQNTNMTPENGGGDPAGLQTETTAAAAPRIVGGTVAIAAAAACLILVAFLIVRRRRSAGSVYQPYVDEKDLVLDEDFSISTSESTYADGSPAKVDIVNDELNDESFSTVDEEDARNLSYYEEDMVHDPSSCASSTCQICRAAEIRGPIFISPDVHDSIKMDLGPPTRPTPSDRQYAVADTVEL